MYTRSSIENPRPVSPFQRPGRPSSIHSTGSSNAADSTQPQAGSAPSSPFGDFFNRRSSVSSINILSNAPKPSSLKLGGMGPLGQDGVMEERNEKLRERVRKASTDLSTTAKVLLNDSSLALYRVSEHIHKKVPILVGEKKSLRECEHEIDKANLDIAYARNTVAVMQRLEEFSKIEETLERCLDMLNVRGKI